MNWLQKACQYDTQQQEAEQQEAERYFSIGHGDYNEEHGFEPNYIVWAYINGKIEVGPEGTIDQSGGTHGRLWGHDVTNRTYKGRYEPQTGRLSIVKPEGTAQYRDVPVRLMSDLRHKFENISEVFTF